MPMEEEEVLKRPVNQSRAESRQRFLALWQAEEETESGRVQALYMSCLGSLCRSVSAYSLFVVVVVSSLYLLLLRIYKFSVCFSYTFAAASQTEAAQGRQSR